MTNQPPPTTKPAESESPSRPPKPSRPRKPQLKPKQALFLKNYTDRKSPTFGNAKQSALKAGYAQEYAEKILGVLSENVALSMADAMERAGVTDARLVEVLTDGLEAKRVISARITDKDADVDTDDFIEVPDHPTRHKFLDTAIKIKGSYAAEKHEHTGANGAPLIIERPTPDGGEKAKAQTPSG